MPHTRRSSVTVARGANARNRSHSFIQPLERRVLLSAAVGSQPTGALSGRIIFMSGGHGYTNRNTTDFGWETGRPLTNGMVEDLGNQDQMSALAQWAFNAGATVVPMRPVGHQTNEVVLDNDSATFTGTWTNGTSSPYFSKNSGNDAVRYRSATSSLTETATARYTPNIPQAGFYPVYGWALNGTNRVTDQLYRVTYAGGVSEVKINHQRVGKGWIYLGTYYFNAGSSGYVEISNKSATAGGAVIADAIRFGNGMGDIDRGGGISGKSREDEQSLYWIQASAGFTGANTPVDPATYRGTLSLDQDANVGAPPRWARWMNDATVGAATDRLFLSYHSNAGSGANRGTLGLYNGNNDPTTATPHQLDWAGLMGHTVTDELVGWGSQVENAWANNSTVTLDRSDIEFGEINDHSISGEFDATICEVAYHDNAQDAQDMLDPDVRGFVARASVHAMVKYFNQFGGGVLNFMPDAPTNVRATTNSSGDVTVSWTAPTATNGSAAATGYMVYQSTNGYGFDGGTLVAGGATTSLTIPAAQVGSGANFFRVSAVNVGGESMPSEVVAARKTPSGAPKVLIVNGFDRMDRSSDEKLSYTGVTGSAGAVTAGRVRLRYNNTHDYSVQAANAIVAYAGAAVGFDSVQNDAVRDGSVNLGNYQAVIWLSGEQSSADVTFTAAEQTAATNYLNAGGRIFVSGSEVGFDLVSAGHGSSFFTGTLKSTYVADDANNYAVTGSAGSIFSGISLGFDNGTSGTYDVDFPDVIGATGGSSAAMNYSGSSNVAATQFTGAGTQRVVMMAFPFETITTAANRNAVMSAVLSFFSLGNASAQPAAPDLAAARDSGLSSTDNVTNNNNSSAGRSLQFTVAGTVAGATVTIFADGVAIGSAVASGTTTTVTTNGTSTLNDGQRTITAGQTEPGKSPSLLSGSLTITVDATPPAVTAATFNYLTGHSITYQFAESVSPTFSAGDVSVQNLTTAQTIAAASQSSSYNTGTNVGTLTFPGVNGGVAQGILASGNYRATIAAGNVADVAGNTLAADQVFNFFFLSGDANHDKAVDLTDFTILASNFNGTGKNSAQGDFNYDGTVDLTDFAILAGNFNVVLPADGTSSVAGGTSAAALQRVAPAARLSSTLSSDEASSPKSEAGGPADAETALSLRRETLVDQLVPTDADELVL